MWPRCAWQRAEEPPCATPRLWLCSAALVWHGMGGWTLPLGGGDPINLGTARCSPARAFARVPAVGSAVSAGWDPSPGPCSGCHTSCSSSAGVSWRVRCGHEPGRSLSVEREGVRCSRKARAVPPTFPLDRASAALCCAGVGGCGRACSPEPMEGCLQERGMKFQGQPPHWRARGPPARPTWAKLPTRGPLLAGTAFAAGRAFVGGAAPRPRHTGLTHLGDVDAVQKSQTNFQLQGQGMRQPGHGSPCRKWTCTEAWGALCWTRRARAQQGRSFFASSLAVPLSPSASWGPPYLPQE